MWSVFHQIPCRETVYRAVDVVNTGRFPFTVELVNGTESPPARTTVTLQPEHRSAQPSVRTCLSMTPLVTEGLLEIGKHYSVIIVFVYF